MPLTIPGKDPYGDGETEFRISDQKVDSTRYEPEQKFCELVHTLPLVLKAPMAIFEGLEREGFEKGLCFTGKTDRYRLRQAVETPFPRGKVFAIYMDKSRFIFEWRLEREDPEHDGHPVRWTQRFTRRLWPD